MSLSEKLWNASQQTAIPEFRGLLISHAKEVKGLELEIGELKKRLSSYEQMEPIINKQTIDSAVKSLELERNLARQETISKVLRAELNQARKVAQDLGSRLRDSGAELERFRRFIKWIPKRLTDPVPLKERALSVLGACGAVLAGDWWVLTFIEDADETRNVGNNSTSERLYILAGNPGKEIHQATCGVQPGDSTKRKATDVSGADCVSVQEATE